MDGKPVGEAQRPADDAVHVLRPTRAWTSGLDNETPVTEDYKQGDNRFTGKHPQGDGRGEVDAATRHARIVRTGRTRRSGCGRFKRFIRPEPIGSMLPQGQGLASFRRGVGPIRKDASHERQPAREVHQGLAHPEAQRDRGEAAGEGRAGHPPRRRRAEEQGPARRRAELRHAAQHRRGPLRARRRAARPQEGHPPLHGGELRPDAGARRT